MRFQKGWFAELHSAGYAVPHWPAEWGGGMGVDRQVVLYQELAAHDAPRLVLAFVGIHHAASTLLIAGTDEQRRRHLPAILDGEIWVQGFSEPEAGSDLAALRTTARRCGDEYVVNGQKLWASGGLHADWCLLLARTDPDAPKRKGISYFLLDMTTPGVRGAADPQRRRRLALLRDLPRRRTDPGHHLVGAENAGWQVAQATLGAERGMTMLELAERLGNAGLRWLVESAPVDDPIVADRLAAVRNRDHRAARTVPADRRARRERTGRRVDRQAVLQRTAAAAHRLRRRTRRTRRAHRADQTAVERLGIAARGCWISSAPGSGPSPAGPVRSSARSSPNAGWACPESRAWRDGTGSAGSGSSTTNCGRSPTICWPRTARSTGRRSSTPAGPVWRCPNTSAAPARPSPRPRSSSSRWAAPPARTATSAAPYWPPAR